MKTEFALSLSTDGIDLLHQSAKGWKRLGHVDVESASLDADLAALRAQADESSPDGFATKLVIPHDQIKFLTLEKADASVAEVHAALEGTTPYSLFDLEIDHVSEGGKTHIAAVARKTLKEAEDFADDHGFRPVAFVAVPPADTFPQEVWFGPTSILTEILGEDAEVTRGSIPSVVTGTRLKLQAATDVAVDAGTDEPTLPEDAVTSAVDAACGETTLPDATEASESEPVPQDDVVEQADDSGSAEVPVADVPTFTPVNPAYYDPVIAEVHTETARVQEPAVAKTAAAPQPNHPATPLGAAPTRAPAQAEPRGPGLRIAAGLAVLALIGAGIFAATTREGPVEVAAIPVATEPAPILADAAPEPVETGPVIGELQVTGFAPGAVANNPGLELAAPDRATAGTTPPVPSFAEAETLPRIPLAPPPPLSEEVSARAEVARSVPTPDEARAFYEATGVWLRAPRLFDEPSGVIALGLGSTAPYAPYQPVARASELAPSPSPEVVFVTPINPPPPGAEFDRDERGFVIATAEGAVTPEGAVVFAGLPDIPFTPRPELSEDDLARMALLAPPPDGVVIASGTPAVLPQERPEDLVPEDLATVEPTTESPAQASPGAVGLAGLELDNSGTVFLDTLVVEQAGSDAIRPRLRPQLVTPETELAAASPSELSEILEGVVAADATLRFDNSTALAVTSSLRPELRPSGLAEDASALMAQRATARLVAAATEIEDEAPESATLAIPQNNQPVPGGVARAATMEDAIRLREINLIGVYGRSSEPRALVRLSNGRFVRVEIGSELDGGQVVAIGDETLNYVKRGRTYVITLPES